jgi:hypothetical protein
VQQMLHCVRVPYSDWCSCPGLNPPDDPCNVGSTEETRRNKAAWSSAACCTARCCEGSRSDSACDGRRRGVQASREPQASTPPSSQLYSKQLLGKRRSRTALVMARDHVECERVTGQVTPRESRAVMHCRSSISSVSK